MRVAFLALALCGCQLTPIARSEHEITVLCFLASCAIDTVASERERVSVACIFAKCTGKPGEP